MPMNTIGGIRGDRVAAWEGLGLDSAEADPKSKGPSVKAPRDDDLLIRWRSGVASGANDKILRGAQDDNFLKMACRGLRST